jgi:hypothetical protein
VHSTGASGAKGFGQVNRERDGVNEAVGLHIEADESAIIRTVTCDAGNNESLGQSQAFRLSLA